MGCTRRLFRPSRRPAAAAQPPAATLEGPGDAAPVQELVPSSKEQLLDLVKDDAALPLAVGGAVSELWKRKLLDTREEYEAVIEALGGHGMSHIAAALTQRMWGLPEAQRPAAPTYAAAIRASAKNNETEEALQQFYDMRQRSIAPDTEVYAATMAACDVGKRWERALELLGELEADSVKPDATTIFAAMQACRRGLQWETAQKLLQEARQDVAPVPVATLNAAISTFSDARRWQDSLRLLDEMGDRADVDSYRYTLRGLEGAGNWEVMLQLLGALRASGTDVKGDVSRWSLYGIASDALERAGEFERAAEIYGELLEAGSVPFC